MVEANETRKLTTVLAADVAGYSRLMADDEASTVRTLRYYREIIRGLVARHEGRVVDTTGDGVLAEFGSPVEALRCAISIQEELGVRNGELPEDRRMEFRIGVNVGDVIVEGDVLFGDAVNIAARLESVADPGAICISGSTFEHVKNKLSVGFRNEGEQSVKNIPYPVPAYSVIPGQRLLVGGQRATGRRWGLAALLALFLVGGAGAAAWALWDGKDRNDQAEASARKAAAKAAAGQQKALELAQRRADEAERRRVAAEAKLKAAEAARRKAEYEARRRALEEAKRRAAADARRKAEAEAARERNLAAMKLKAAEEARRKAEAEARRLAELEARRRAEAEARRKAESDAKRKAEEEAKRKVAAEAKQKAEAEEAAKRKAARLAREKAAQQKAAATRQRQLAVARRRQAAARGGQTGVVPGAGSRSAGGYLTGAQIRQTFVGRSAVFRRRHRFRPAHVSYQLRFRSASQMYITCQFRRDGNGSQNPCNLNGRSFRWSTNARAICWSINRPICFRVMKRSGNYEFHGNGFFRGAFFLR